jgi:hypothetical protein
MKNSTQPQNIVQSIAGRFLQLAFWRSGKEAKNTAGESINNCDAPEELQQRSPVALEELFKPEIKPAPHPDAGMIFQYIPKPAPREVSPSLVLIPQHGKSNFMKTWLRKSGVLIIIFCITNIFIAGIAFGQTTIVNYNFNSGTTFATLSPTLAANITSTATGSATFATATGVASGAGAFTTNATAGSALTSAPNTTWTFTLGAIILYLLVTVKMEELFQLLLEV